MLTIRKCPDCGDPLKSGAKFCACGWEESPKANMESPLLKASCDHQCTWRANNKRCRYPVKMFEPGSTVGKCRYHKDCEDGLVGAQIVEQSHKDTDEDYQRRSDFETYGKTRSSFEQQVFDNLYANRG